MKLTNKQYKQFINNRLDIKEKQNKYRNKKVEYNGITFDREKECEHYKLLKILEKSGMIKDLQLQVKFELQPAFEKNGIKYKAIKYIADFVYFDVSAHKKVVVDVKGYRNQVYLLKKKLFEYKYKDVFIKEI